MMNKHKDIENLLKDKIQTLEKGKNKENIGEIDKFNKLYRLITNQYKPFFSKVDINIAMRILKDIGIPQEELMVTYEALIKEEIKKGYTLINTDLNNKEEER